MDESLFQSILKKSLQGDLRGRITGTDVSNHIKSPYITYCNAFVESSEKDPTSSYVKLLADLGIDHENQVIEERFDDPVELIYDDQINGFKQVIEHMAGGSNQISNAPLLYLPEKLICNIDILEKQTTQNSLFGNYHYVINEIKVAKDIKEYHIYQALFYNKILGIIQNYTPEFVYIIDNKGDVTEYRYSDYEEKLDMILNQIKDIRAGTFQPIPVYNGISTPWSNYANKMAQEMQDVSCLIDVGPSMQDKLHNHNIYTINDVFNADISKLTSIPGIGKTKATAYKLHADAILNNKRIKLGETSLKRHEFEIFIDFEGVDPITAPAELGSYDYLFGVITRDKDDKIIFYPFFIDNPEDINEVKNIFTQFLDLLESNKDAPIYHWHSYEKTRMKLCFDKFALPHEKNQVLSRFIDLYREFKSTWVFPISSLSIKYVAVDLGFKWTDSQFDGQEAIAKYIEYLEDKESKTEIKDKIIQYNKDDILALIHILDWMVQNR
ncbi:MAG: TM0106 family RecB-like putative nuclease [Candidatus Heimdallarchaeota archaeon]|nr:TM0106 family RecB-like putative nuclease [Candidatus Heimdallarchaeota archaeon]